MKYIKQYKDNSEAFEVNREEARRTLECAYKPEAIDELLELPGSYNCWFSILHVEE